MGTPKYPEVGDLIIDASDIKVTDITPEQIQKLTKLRDGFEAAVKNLLGLKPEDADRAGLNEKDKERLAAAFARDQRIGELLPASQKLTELLHETRQTTRHEIATILAENAAQAKRRADRVQNGAEVLGPVAPLMDYQYGPANKAAATKEKAKEPKQEV
ncbi:hypothetical protein KEG38_22720 [Polyangium jinanense]|uniref:hypothetical protein n=1 Tax=Polyangium jinanense TaxID=2829994 RepID=UPI00234040DF|nr:hypothetical protein [Polyangium jinanense]MDC3956692.1 hypothetical protein [Polyangium jinanense]